MIDCREFYTQLLAWFKLDAETSSGLIISEKVKEHQTRVGNYAFDIAHKLGESVEVCWQCWLIGNLHDWVEDCNDTDKDRALRAIERIITQHGRVGIGGLVRTALWCLTKQKGISYETYMDFILKRGNNTVGDIVFIVKQADYKDHFAQVETLTPKLMKKYAPFVHYFL